MSERYDVCVFGLGPAGAATAARLADLGVAAIVLERPPARKPWGGESFAGAIRTPLTTLGLWDRFCAAGPVTGYEQRSAWGETGIADSIFSAHGNAWHVDRDRFDDDLRAAVVDRGIAIVRYTGLDALQRFPERQGIPEQTFAGPTAVRFRWQLLSRLARNRPAGVCASTLQRDCQSPLLHLFRFDLQFEWHTEFRNLIGRSR